MFGSKNSNRANGLPVIAALLLLPLVATADFDAAAKAYLLGEFEKARYEALVAASDGNPAAQMLLGQLYYNGEGVEKDIDHALYWYNRAADNGFADAQHRLGMLYHNGAPGVNKNLDLAYIYLNQALENGRKDAREILEWLHKTEQGIVVNLNDDVEVLKKVAATGNQKARLLLSQKMLKGTGIAQDRATAVKMLREDAEVGFIKAQKQLGELFFYGEGVEIDYIEAYAWSMAYAGTKKLGGIAREGKQIARSALRKLPQESHDNAYVKSKEYFEKYVLPFHKNAREVGPDKYRIVVRSRVEAKAPVEQAGAKPQAAIKDKVAKIDTTPPAQESSVKKDGAPDIVKPAEKIQKGADNQPLKADKSSSSNKLIASERQQATAVSVPTVPTPESAGVSSKVKKENAPSESGEQSIDDPKSVTGPVASREDLEVIPASPIETKSPEVGNTETGVDLAEREFEEVYNVLVRKKPALYQIYLKEYELNKQLEGRMVFDIRIAPDGKISSIEVVSNTVDSPTLEQTLIDYLKTNISFVSKKVAEFKITYPVDFLPP